MPHGHENTAPRVPCRRRRRGRRVRMRRAAPPVGWVATCDWRGCPPTRVPREGGRPSFGDREPQPAPPQEGGRLLGHRRAQLQGLQLTLSFHRRLRRRQRWRWVDVRLDVSSPACNVTIKRGDGLIRYPSTGALLPPGRGVRNGRRRGVGTDCSSGATAAGAVGLLDASS